jgi:hypothetical protein
MSDLKRGFLIVKNGSSSFIVTINLSTADCRREIKRLVSSIFIATMLNNVSDERALDIVDLPLRLSRFPFFSGQVSYLIPEGKRLPKPLLKIGSYITLAHACAPVI